MNFILLNIRLVVTDYFVGYLRVIIQINQMDRGAKNNLAALGNLGNVDFLSVI